MQTRHTLIHVVRDIEGKGQDSCVLTITTLNNLIRVRSFMIVRFEGIFWCHLGKTRVKLTAPPRSDRFVVSGIQLAPYHGAWHD